MLAERLAAGLRPRLVHTVSSFHNPRGVTLAPDRRRALAGLADRYGFLVVEDDPYGLLAFDGAPARPVAAHSDRVLRLGSASKIVAPALRVGWLTGPPVVVAAVERLKQGTDLCGSSLTQAIAAELLADTGWLDAHLTTTRAVTAARARAFTAAVADRLPAVACTTPTGGMFCWLEFPERVTSGHDRAAVPGARRGRGFVPGAAFAVHADQTRAARCCYASVDEATLAEAVARLASCVSSAGSTTVAGSIALIQAATLARRRRKLIPGVREGGNAARRPGRASGPVNGRGRRTRVIVVRQILELLERDATLTPETLATMTGEPVEEVRAQIAAWERSGAIRRYRAVVDWDGRGRRPDPRDGHRVHRRVDRPGPRRRVRRRGGPDRAVRGGAQRLPGVRQPGPALHGHRPDIRAVSDFVSQKLSTIDRVRSTATHFVLKTYKRDGDAFRKRRARPPAAGDAVKPLNEVIAACPPSGIRKFFDIAAERDDVISLGVGEPDFVTPWRVREAGIYALEHGYTTYTSNAGLPKLRELICADLNTRYGAEYRGPTSA